MGEIGCNGASNSFYGQFDSVLFPMVWRVWLRPSFLVFLLVTFRGAIIVFLRSGLLGVWFGLEFNFFGFIPLLLGNRVRENEATIKYFVVQALGSGFFILSVLILLVKPFISVVNINIFFYCIFFCGVFIKIGFFPFHFWFPSVIGVVSWFNCFFLSIWQKLGPLWVIRGIGSKLLNLFLILVVLTSFVGGVGGLGQTHFRSLLAYSSLVHRGWIGILCLLSQVSFLTYLIIYRLILIPFLISLWKGGRSCVLRLSGVSYKERRAQLIWIGVYFLSLRGLPPLFGAFLKLYGIIVLYKRFLFFLIVLVFSSLIRIFYYLNIFFNFFVCLGGVSFFIDRLKTVFNLKINFLISLAILVNCVIGLVFLTYIGLIV